MKSLLRPPAESDVIDHVAGSALIAGAVVLFASGIGILQNTAASGAKCALVIRGQVRVAKVSAQAWAAGAKVYWDSGAALFTTTVGANTLAGFAIVAAANPSSLGDLYLTGPPGT